MENYTEIKNKLGMIIEQSNCDKPSCKNCKCGRDCGRTCALNESRLKLTSPAYSCDKFEPVYKFNESTLDSLRDLMNDLDRVNEGLTNLDLLLSGKLSEEDFNDIVR